MNMGNLSVAMALLRTGAAGKAAIRSPLPILFTILVNPIRPSLGSL